jgi:transposase InsO family protein
MKFQQTRPIESDTTLAAWQMALTQQRPPPGLVHHSDRGVQYASQLYRQNLQVAGVVSSMSRRGNCYDNAAMESFWSVKGSVLTLTQTGKVVKRFYGAAIED